MCINVNACALSRAEFCQACDSLEWIILYPLKNLCHNFHGFSPVQLTWPIAEANLDQGAENWFPLETCLNTVRRKEPVCVPLQEPESGNQCQFKHSNLND